MGLASTLGLMVKGTKEPIWMTRNMATGFTAGLMGVLGMANGPKANNMVKVST
jgi:VIT1/CCC1 family predicted Fe2+/Mn2+ transporter